MSSGASGNPRNLNKKFDIHAEPELGLVSKQKASGKEVARRLLGRTDEQAAKSNSSLLKGKSENKAKEVSYINSLQLSF